MARYSKDSTAPGGPCRRQSGEAQRLRGSSHSSRLAFLKRRVTEADAARSAKELPGSFETKSAAWSCMAWPVARGPARLRKSLGMFRDVWGFKTSLGFRVTGSTEEAARATDAQCKSPGLAGPGMLKRCQGPMESSADAS